MSETDKTTKTPEDTLREGPLKSTIWRNEGRNGDFFTTQYTRAYKDQDGAWHETTQMRESDHLPLRHLSGKTHDRIMAMKRDERERRARRERKPRDPSPGR